MVDKLGIETLSPAIRLSTLETFYKGYDDYAIDNRGDVGCFVREQSMISLKKYVHLLMSSQNQEIISELGADKPEFFERFVGANLQQLNEKIDRVRETAGRQLQEFYKFTVPLI